MEFAGRKFTGWEGGKALRAPAGDAMPQKFMRKEPTCKFSELELSVQGCLGIHL